MHLEFWYEVTFLSFRYNSQCRSSEEENCYTIVSLMFRKEGPACKPQNHHMPSEGREPQCSFLRYTWTSTLPAFMANYSSNFKSEAPTSCGLSDTSQKLRRIPVYFCSATQGGFAQGQRAAAAAGCATTALPISMPSREAWKQNNSIQIYKEQQKSNSESGLTYKNYLLITDPLL